MTSAPSAPSPLVEATARLHDVTTLFHAFIYFAPEAAEEYESVGLSARPGYFASRTAAMGPLPAEMVIATFYNFNPAIVTKMMEGVWNGTSADEVQAARWRAAARVLDVHVGPVMSDDQVERAIELAQAAVDGFSWAGRPLAAGNGAMLRQLASGDLASNRLLYLWQLVTVMREWRGDAHIGLLIAEPLSGVECTVVSAAVAGNISGPIRASRAWSDQEWDAAVLGLAERGWVSDDGVITDDGRDRRAAIEHRTNELAASMLDTIGVGGAEELRELLKAATAALLAANYFAAIGRPARSKD